MKTILEAIDDPLLLGGSIQRPESFAAWRVFLSALFALPCADDDARALYTSATGRTDWPLEPATEAYAICSRRSRKTLMLSACAVYLACCRDWPLAPGERGTIFLIACDRRQSRTALGYIKSFLQSSPLFSRMIERETAESIDLSNGVSIEIAAPSFRTTRGYTVLATLLDEAAFFRSDDSASPDREIVAALLPSMATVSGSLLMVASSPYARKGILWDARRRYYGVNGSRVLVWQAGSRTMNPLIAESVIDAAVERDSARASSEWLGQFRADLESFVSRESVEGCVETGIFERPPSRDHHYVAFCDPSGGSADSMTLAIGHAEADRVVVDCVREAKPPFSPESVVEEFCQLLARYGIHSVRGDRYAGEWPREQFSKRNVRYEPAALPKSDLYRELLPVLNAKQIVLLDDARTVSQLASLERRTGRGGKDQIDHPEGSGSHDDRANAVAGVAYMAGAGTQGAAFAAALVNKIFTHDVAPLWPK